MVTGGGRGGGTRRTRAISGRPPTAGLARAAIHPRPDRDHRIPRVPAFGVSCQAAPDRVYSNRIQQHHPQERAPRSRSKRGAWPDEGRPDSHRRTQGRPGRSRGQTRDHCRAQGQRQGGLDHEGAKRTKRLRRKREEHEGGGAARPFALPPSRAFVASRSKYPGAEGRPS